MANVNHNETWRSVPGFKHLEASTHGRVRTRDWRIRDTLGREYTRKGRVLKTHQMFNSGYRVLIHEGKAYPVHRIVAAAFHGPSERGQVVNHKNGIKDDNKPGNLEWVSRSENCLHAIATGLRGVGESHPLSKLTEQAVRSARLEHRSGASVAELARKYGVGHNAMTDVVRKRTWRHVT